MIESVVMITSS